MAFPPSKTPLSCRVARCCLGLLLFFAPMSQASAVSQDRLVLFSLMRQGLGMEGGEVDLKSLQKACDLVETTGLAAASLATECRSAYDRQAVYFFLEMREMQTQGRDSVEVWISPNGKRYHQFLIGRDGQVQTFLRSTGSAVAVKTPCEVKVTQGKSGWTARLRVPFQAIGAEVPADNARWGFNVARNGLNKEGVAELSSWARVVALEQTKRFGKLAFYSRANVEADIAYWENNKDDPLLRRSSVSGLETAKAMEGETALQPASFWTYDPYAADRKADAAWGCRGLTDSLSSTKHNRPKNAQAEYPEFFNLADQFNRSLVALSQAEEQAGSLERAEAYLRPEKPSETSKELGNRLDKVQSDLDKVFQIYRAAFKAGWKADLLKDAPSRLSETGREIAAIQSDAQKALAVLQDRQQARKPWTPLNTELEVGDERRDQNGVPQRYWFTAMRSQGVDPLDRYFSPFRSFNIDWPRMTAESPAPGKYTLPNFDAALNRLVSSDAKFSFQTTLGLASYQSPSPEWLEKEIARDPSMLAATSDGLEMPSGPVPIAEPKLILRTGINIEHPRVIDFARDYLTHVLREANKTNRLDFVVTGWEDSMELALRAKGSPTKVKRHRGYDPVSQRAFQDYLQQKYGSIEVLKKRWNVGGYTDFSEVKPPGDAFLSPRQPAGGLTYEWGRWQRRSHFQWAARLRQFAKEGAPHVPVMIDDSHLLSAGTAREALEGPSADILSFHSNPANEDAMFAYLGSLARRKGIALGCFENYCMMYSRLEGEDERLAKLSLRRHFYDLAARDVHILTFWIQYVTNPTPYVAAYGGGVLRLDNDQTILRWPTTEIMTFMDRIKQVERALVESAPVPGKIAVIVPDSSNIQLASLYGNARRPGAEMDQIVQFQNAVLSETNLPAEYLHEETLAETQEDLSSYDAVFIADAPFIQEKALRKLSAWTSRPGKTLFVAGPLGYFDELGQPLNADDSPLRKSFPKLSLDPNRPWRFPKPAGAKRDLLERAAFGQGGVVRLQGNIGDFAASPAPLQKLRALVEEAVPGSVSITGEQIHFQERHGRDGETYLLISNRDVQNRRDFEVRIDGRFNAIHDILIPGWFPVRFAEAGGRTRFSGTLAAGDWTLLKLEPAGAKR